MKWLLSLLLVMISSTAYSVDCKKHKVYCKVIELRPNIDKKWAMKFSNIIYKKAVKYQLDPIRSVCIGMQESSLRLIDREQNILVFKKECNEIGMCTEEARMVKGISDVSVWMFHVDTIVAYNKDPILLRTDLEYATDFHFSLLKKKMNLCKNLGKDAWTCYHSKTEKHRLNYKNLVNRFCKVKK